MTQLCEYHIFSISAYRHNTLNQNYSLNKKKVYETLSLDILQIRTSRGNYRYIYFHESLTYIHVPFWILLWVSLRYQSPHFHHINSLFSFLFQNSEISLFETNIRFMGSLLACYALTGDVMFRDKAAQLGERMLPAFQTETGIPHSLINLHTGVSFGGFTSVYCYTYPSC